VIRFEEGVIAATGGGAWWIHLKRVMEDAKKNWYRKMIPEKVL
jgi:hypothetical protein